ncbi:unnamed protein product [Lactuca saligna]|uniref:Uncharacterized protein n=1 Tax=Lactuca saligna TaxID=75948 RepID=A0AA35YYS7_LACSI|nr:unnamed protein product [Lactuca saligna]
MLVHRLPHHNMHHLSAKDAMKVVPSNFNPLSSRLSKFCSKTSSENLYREGFPAAQQFFHTNLAARRCYWHNNRCTGSYRLAVGTSHLHGEIPSLQVGPLGHPRPWLFRESRSCLVGLVARQSTGWVCLSEEGRLKRRSRKCNTTRGEPKACAKEEANQSEWRQGGEKRKIEQCKGERSCPLLSGNPPPHMSKKRERGRKNNRFTLAHEVAGLARGLGHIIKERIPRKGVKLRLETVSPAVASSSVVGSSSGRVVYFSELFQFFQNLSYAPIGRFGLPPLFPISFR